MLVLPSYTLINDYFYGVCNYIFVSLFFSTNLYPLHLTLCNKLNIKFMLYVV